jgi:lysylphosphatidylglycerol synthetase-like protein (DUF2156 family)
VQTEKMDTTEIANYVKRWGSSASIALLDPTCSIFKTSNVDGLIGYQTKGKLAFVTGDPVCDASAQENLSKAFEDFCSEKKLTVVYTQISENFANNEYQKHKGALLEVGYDLYVDPRNDPTIGNDSRMLRKKVHRAQNEGVKFHEYRGDDPTIEKSMEEAKSAWLKGRKGPQIFLSHVYLFTNRIAKRWFYATKGDKIVGVIMLNRLDAKSGWLINFLMATPDAPVGTTEFLVVSLLEALRREDCSYLAFGVTPSPKINKIIGLNKFSSWLARAAFKGTKWFFHLDNRRIFWEKFKPKGDKSHVLFIKQDIGLKDVFSYLKALNARL